MLRYIAPLIFLVILIGFFIKGLDPNRDLNRLPSPFLDKPAPEMDLPNLANLTDRVTSADYEGELTLVNVWATWCVGCRQEHGYLLELARQGTVPIYGLNWRDQRDDALNWLAQLGNPYVASGYDADGRVGIDWGVYGAPETFLIGKDGRVLYKHLGPLNASVWEQDFMPHIRADRGIEQ
jgi:cytochrome c biogenesis protein CcmG, thiol:disulfide interchange protein DsbE